MRKMKRVEDSRTENTYLIMNKHINSYGRLFGGVLMQWIDEMAGIVAHRHAGTRQRLKRQNGRVRKNVMHSERKEGLKDSEKFSDRNVTGENRWQKELASYLIHTDC